ncbi:MAG: 16S rRNA (uracil(1498)-N(3))-methyltransferase [Oscillospiraceae bacterium]|nr:16S rRNA (uracil(1498)-N(3))-methyltransferase [Oscillospiraceae bacterium]
MPKFFIDNKLIRDNIYEISGEDALHIKKSLRKKVGDNISLSDGCGYDYDCIIINITKCIVLNIQKIYLSKTEVKKEIILCQALPKGDKLDFIIQKAVELGVSMVVPFISNRCVSRPKKEILPKKNNRYNKIALEAAKQSLRSKIPVVHEIISFSDCLNMIGEKDKGIIFYEEEGKKLCLIEKELFKSERIFLFIGSEGGFEKQEIEMAIAKNFSICTLGNRILRCETASITGISVLMHIIGEI